MDSHRIVVGVEGSGYALAALIWAIQEAEVRNSLVEVVTVHGPTFVPASPDLGYVPLDSFDLLNEVENTQSEVIESALAATNNPDIEIRRTVVKGRAADTLLKVAKGADLLVVGNRGRGGFSGLRLGSVSQSISHHSPCPLVIVRTGLNEEIGNSGE